MINSTKQTYEKELERVIKYSWNGKLYFGYYIPAVNQIHTYLKRGKIYRKNWYAPCNGALFLLSVQVFVRNTFGGMYLIFNGVQAYGCIIIVIIIIITVVVIIINCLSSIL